MTSAVTTPLLLEGHWTSESAGEGHVVFNAEGIHCGNCARAIQRALDELPGVIRADVNVVNSRVSVTWDPTKASLGTILGKVASTGFRPVPLVGESAVAAQRNERRDAQKRIGLAGLASMQLMMYAGGLYAGAFDGIDPHWADILRIACLIIATPVLFYSGAPILAGAIADLRRRVLGMDITVSLALVLAYAASVLNTFRGSGEVYFDSVAAMPRCAGDIRRAMSPTRSLRRCPPMSSVSIRRPAPHCARRSLRSVSAIDCASAAGRSSRSMAACSKARHSSTNHCSPASRHRTGAPSATSCSAVRSMPAPRST
jgi:copper chaperone CopZ